MRILVITSCTGRKSKKSKDQLAYADFEKGKEHVAQRQRVLADLDLVLPARKMYKGPQHVNLVNAISEIECNRQLYSHVRIDLYIISAGYGLIQGEQEIAPYNLSRADPAFGSIEDWRRWAVRQGIPTEFRRVVEPECDLGILLLGNDYLTACAIDSSVRFGGITVALCGKADAKRLRNLSVNNLFPFQLPASDWDNLSIKGTVAAKLLRCVCSGKLNPVLLTEPEVDLLTLLKKCNCD
jgi:hypothetical protein